MFKKLLGFFLFYCSLSVWAQSAGLIIHKIQFEGNQSVSSEELSQVIQSHEGDSLNVQLLNDDAGRILNFYKSKGIHFIYVSYPRKIPLDNYKAEIVFSVYEMDKLIFKKIVFEGSKYLTSDKLNELVNPAGKSFQTEDIEKLVSDVLDIYLERGFLFCEVSFKQFDFSDEYVLVLKVSEGAQCYFDHVILNKGIISSEKSLLKISGLKKNKILTQKILENAQRSLEKKEYIKEALIYPLDPKTLMIHVDETKMTKLSGIIGFNNADENNKLVGTVSFKFLNLFGADRSIDFLWRKLNKNQSLVRFIYDEPGPYVWQIGSNLSFEREMMDSTYIRILTNMDLFFYDQHNRYGLSFGFNDINPGSRIYNAIEKTTQQKSGLFWQYQGFDYDINPRKGSSFEFRYNYIREKQTADLTIKRQSITGNMELVHPLWKQWVMFYSLNGRYLENKSLSFYDLFRMGGTFSLRGFKEDNFSGNKLGWLNTEVRYLIDRDARFFAFCDYGYVMDERPDVKAKMSDLIGAGLGLRISTRLGILHIDYAVKHEAGQWSHPLDGFIHFGIESSL